MSTNHPNLSKVPPHEAKDFTVDDVEAKQSLKEYEWIATQLFYEHQPLANMLEILAKEIYGPNRLKPGDHHKQINALDLHKKRRKRLISLLTRASHCSTFPMLHYLLPKELEIGPELEVKSNPKTHDPELLKMAKAFSGDLHIFMNLDIDNKNITGIVKLLTDMEVRMDNDKSLASDSPKHQLREAFSERNWLKPDSDSDSTSTMSGERSH